MKRIHPNVSRAFTRAANCAVIALTFAFGGCRSTSTGVTNPFLAPDRVPPPATHVLLPGQAQPYYQGDPLPAAHARTNPPTAAAASQVAVRNDPAALSSTGRRLAWSEPGTTPTAPSPAATAPPAQRTSPPATPQIAAANEAPVAVPADSDPLRFSLPPSSTPENTQQVVAAAPAPNTRPVQPLVTRPTPAVQLATYNAPSAPTQPTVATAPTLPASPQINTPWRTPQLPAATAAPPTYAVQPPTVQPTSAPPLSLPAPPAAPTAQPGVASANTMPVTLRPVSSPPLSGETTPRIRMPSYIAQQATASDGFRPRTSMQ